MGHFGISEGSITTTPPPPKKSNLRIQTKKAITRGELPHSLVSTHDEWGLCIEAPSSSSVFRIKMGKILKEMGIPDHLICLLGKLYAGQEATVRTGHGTTDWFQIGKKSTSRLYIATLFI